MTGVLLLTLIRATVILALGFGVVAALRRRSAAVRSTVWAAVLGSLLLLPGLSGGAPPLRIAVPVAVLPRPVPPLASVAQAPSPPPTGVQEEATSTRRDATAWLVPVWALGVVVLLGGLLRDLSQVRRLVASARPLPETAEASLVVSQWAQVLRLPVPVQVRQGGDAAIPFVTGILRPVIVLPTGSEGWSTARLTSVVLHELGHVARRDYMTHLGGQLARALYWPTPLVWLAVGAARREQERAADDTVLLEGTCPVAYAEDLLALAARPEPASALALVGSRLRQRIRAILDPGQVRSAPGMAGRAGIAVAALAVATLLAALRPIDALSLPIARQLEASLVERRTVDAVFRPVIDAAPGLGVTVERLLFDDAPATRRSAARTLGPAAGLLVPRLIVALRDSTCYGNRWRAARALRDLRAPLAARPVAERLAVDDNPAVRAMLANALASLGPEGAVTLREATDRLDRTRLGLVRAALSTIGAGVGRDRLERALPGGSARLSE